MKWMWSTAFVVIAVSAVSAQSGKDMKPPTMGDPMQATYTGCIVNVNHGASFVLTHVADDRQTMMHHDGMMKSIVLTGRSDLKKHVGQTVTVAGALSHGMADETSKGRDMLAVASLTVVAKSCS